MKKIFAVLTACIISMFALPTATLADDSLSAPTTVSAPTTSAPVLNTDYSVTTLDMSLAAVAGSNGYAGAYDKDGNPVGQTEGFSVTFAEIEGDGSSTTCGGTCTSLGGTIRAKVLAANQMITTAERQDGPLYIESTSQVGAGAWGDLSAYRETTLAPTEPADDSDD